MSWGKGDPSLVFPANAASRALACSVLNPIGDMHKTMMMTMVGFGALLLSTAAHAQDAASPAEAPAAASPEADKPSKTVKASQETVWYGHQTLAVDGAAIGMMALGLN